MLMTGFPFRRLLATFLPLAFLWIFVACISLCCRESLEAHDLQVISTSVETTIEDVPHCGGCPLNSFPKATTPEQLKFDISPTTVASVASQIPSVFYADPHVLNNRIESPPYTASPPLDLLLALRI